MTERAVEIIAHIRTDFPEKFGVPRQSGLAEGLEGRIVFEKKFRNADAVRGIEDFSHLWLIWGFSESERREWSPTVRPPRLGGNTRVGVFATRSPFRPNGLGLSSVRLRRVEITENDGPVLYVSGIDMVDNTPIYDIKPYIPYTDCHNDARGGFADRAAGYSLKVELPQELKTVADEDLIRRLTAVLAGDPRPSYQDDPDRVYGLRFAGYEIKFKVDGDTLRVLDMLREA